MYMCRALFKRCFIDTGKFLSRGFLNTSSNLGFGFADLYQIQISQLGRAVPYSILCRFHLLNSANVNHVATLEHDVCTEYARLNLACTCNFSAVTEQNSIQSQILLNSTNVNPLPTLKHGVCTICAHLNATAISQQSFSIINSNSIVYPNTANISQQPTLKYVLHTLHVHLKLTCRGNISAVPEQNQLNFWILLNTICFDNLSTWKYSFSTITICETLMLKDRSIYKK